MGAFPALLSGGVGNASSLALRASAYGTYGECDDVHLFLVRHGQFVGNIVPEDTPDGPLTDLGRSEAAQVAAVLRNERLTHLLASPLMRGLETATAIAKQSEMRFTVWKETYEYRSQGLYVGPSVAQLQEAYPLAEFESDMEPDGWVCGGTETPVDVLQRAERIANRLQSEFSSTDRVALVAHAGFNSVLLGILLGIPDPHRVKFRQANCCLNVLRFTEDRVHVQAINMSDHITPAASPQPKPQEIPGASA